jgi:hypothetical protein
VRDLPSAGFELFEIGAGFTTSTDARLRSGQMKLATSRSALRPLTNVTSIAGLAPKLVVTVGDGTCGENGTQPRARVSAKWRYA